MLPKEESPYAPLESLFKNGTCYAGIGSRSTPDSILILIGEIAAVLADHGLILRSGGAPGADTAFEAGCDQRNGEKEIFLPWKGFNRNPPPLHPPPKKAAEIEVTVHPSWRAVKSWHRTFQARNVQQVYGSILDTSFNCVLFWAEEENGRVRGGTATAAHLAREMEIPTFNLWDTSTLHLGKNSWAITELWNNRENDISSLELFR